MLFGLGMIEAQQQVPKKAIAYYKLAYDNADDEFQVEILIELALQYQFVNEPDKSFSCYRKALDLGLNVTTTLRELVGCIERFQKLVEGTSVLEKYVDQNPYSVKGWFNLGGLYSLAGSYHKAIDCYDYSIVIKEENPDAYFKKAECLMKLEKYEEALVELTNEIKYRDPIAFNYCVIADCYEQLGQFLQAEEYYRKALKLDDSYSEAYLGLGFLKELNLESGVAISFYLKAIQTDIKNVNAHLLLSNLLCSKGRYEEAALAIQNYLDKEEGIEEMWLELGEIFARSGEFDKALSTVNRGIENALSNEKLWLKKVVYLHKNGAIKESLELMRELLEEDKSISNSINEHCSCLFDDANFIALISQYT
jgi:tetratricopeptide (TPR) repeat protein